MTGPPPEAARPRDNPAGGGRPALGRPSPAAAAEPKLRQAGAAGDAAYRAEGASTSWCRLRAASVAGVRHRLAGRSSDDSYAWALSEQGLVVAVADGVGALTGSALAAARACRTAVTAVAAGGGASAPAALARANQDLADRPDGPEGVSAGATTLVVACLSADGRFEIARVGDSSAWMVRRHAESAVGVELFAAPDPERAGTATDAIPADEPTVETVSGRLSAGQTLCLVTDGVADPWRDGPETVAPVLDEALSGDLDALDLLTLIDFSRQGCHDDRTLLTVRWTAEEEPPAAR